MPQRELLQERRRRTIEKRPSETFSPTDNVDESALVQRFEDRTGADTANLFDLSASDGLAVGDDRQRLERCGRQPLWARGELNALDRFRVFWPRQNLPATGDFNELHTVPVAVVMRS